MKIGNTHRPVLGYLTAKLALALGGLLLPCLLPNALAGTVTTLNDSGPGSLRQAIADATPGDTIDFAVTGRITLTSGQLTITNSVNIAGPGAANLTVSGNNASRVFEFRGVNATIACLTVANGRAGDGGGILNSRSTLAVSNCIVTGNHAPSASNGGGIENYHGNLTVIASLVSSNRCDNHGGGIDNWQGNVAVINSTVCSNRAVTGGGVYSQFGTLAMTNCSVSSNVAHADGGAFGGAGALFVNCTVVGNQATVSVGGGLGWGTIRGCVVAGNSAAGGSPDCRGTINSLDYNLIQNTNDCAITGDTTHNIYGKDPLLGPLADNGGPTPTHALLPGSPAIDQGSSGGLACDQRGQPRPFLYPGYPIAGDGSDIGAYELQKRTVTTLADSGPGSLRQAIADATPGETIDFATNGTITLTSGQLRIDNSLTIAGPGSTNLTVSGNNATRVFWTKNGIVMLSGLTIANGSISPDGDYHSPDKQGAGLYNSAWLTMSNCIVTRNTNSVFYGFGGGIVNTGVITVINSSITRNFSGYGSAIANGVSVNSTAVLNLINSTLSGNRAGQQAALIASGSCLVTNSTISGNQAGGSTGGILEDGGTLRLYSSTVCSNTSPGIMAMSGKVYLGNSAISWNGNSDCSGILISLDYNLIRNTNNCTITNLTAHNIYNLDPKLGPLADNGGPTLTHALRFDSPAIDAGDSGSLTNDQRGFLRPVDGSGDGIAAADIGAYEFLPVPPVITNQPITQTIAPNGQVTFTVGDTGNPPPTYQWYFAGSPIPWATGPSLTITNAGPGQVGCYSVAVTNFAGGFVSAPACLWLSTLKMYAGVNVYGPLGGTCTVQYTTNLDLVPVQWFSLTNVLIEAMPQIFIDYGSADQPKRFYRTVPQ
jgi:hypothetical protein